VCFSPDGGTLASGSQDGTVRLWDAASGAERRTLQGHIQPVYCLSFSPDGHILASGDGRTVHLWDVDTGALIIWRALQVAIRSFWFHPESRQLHVADDGGGTGRPRVCVLEIIGPNPSHS
jgi:WD40 repeat protein